MARREKKPAHMRTGLWLTKDNRLIKMEAVMNPLEYKIFNYFMIKAVQTKQLKNIQVDAATLVKDTNIAKTGYTRTFKKVSDTLTSTKIHIQKPDNPDEFWDLAVIPTAHYKNGIFECSINEDVAPYILGSLPTYTRTEYDQLASCITYAGMRLYEICNSWLSKGWVIYDVDQWRRLLGATSKSYEKFADFNKYIFKPAVQDVNEYTQLRIEQFYTRKWRTVTHIKVKVEAVQPDCVDAEIIQESAEPELLDAPQEVRPISRKPRKTRVRMAIEALDEERRACALKMVDVYKLSATIALKYIKKPGLAYCQAQMECLRKARQGGQINSPGGYLRRALEENYAGQKEINRLAAEAEKKETEDIKLWDRQAKDFFRNMQGQEEEHVETELEKWEYARNRARAEGVKELLAHDMLSPENLDKILAEFDKKYPRPLESPGIQS